MSRKRLLTSGLIVCLVLVLAYLAVDLNKLHVKQVALREQIGASTSTLTLLPTPAMGADLRLTQAQTAYQSALAGVSIKAAPTEIIRSLLVLTDNYHFKVNPITTEQWAKRSIGTVTYRILPINLSLEGNLADILLFIQDLENEDKFPSLEIENTEIAPLTDLSGGSSQYDTALKIRLSVMERLTTSE
jgi:hypothetical protein